MEALTGGYGVTMVWAMGHVSDHSLILVGIPSRKERSNMSDG